jgi:hypothetical protein
MAWPLTAALLAAALVAPTGAGAAPLDPRNDPFYTVPADIGAHPDGAVLASRPVSAALFGYLPIKADAWQLRYRTTDNNEAPTATVATVLVPEVAAPVAGRPRPLVSYQIAEDSNSLQCAPSFGLLSRAPSDNPVGQAEALIIAAYLARGDAVVVPDYEGPDSLYTVGVMAGQATLDAIRAAKSFAPAGIAADAPTGLTGYSGGALATEWAAQLQPTYAPDVSLSAVVAGGIPVNVQHIADHVDRGPSFGALDGVALNGIAGEYKAYPGLAAQVQPDISARGQQIIDKLDTVCNATAISSYLEVPYSAMFTKADPLDSIPQLHQIIAANTLGGATPARVPTYLYQSVGDELTVTPDVDALVRADCAAGVPITYDRDLLSEHISLVVTGAPAAIGWLQGTLTGTKRAATCSTRTTVSTLLSPGGLLGALALVLGLPRVLG